MPVYIREEQTQIRIGADRGPQRGSPAGVVVATGRILNQSFRTGVVVQPLTLAMPTAIRKKITRVEYLAGRYRFRF